MTMTWDFAFHQLNAYLLIFCRMTGVILFNPVFSRRSVPTSFVMGLTMGIALLVTPGLAPSMRPMDNAFSLISGVFAELLVGLAWGLIFRIFYYDFYGRRRH